MATEASKAFLSSPWSPEGAGTELLVLLSPSPLSPAATGHHWWWSKTKEKQLPSNTKPMQRSKQNWAKHNLKEYNSRNQADAFFFFFSYLVVFRCWVKPQVTRVSIQTDRSQNFTSSVLIPGFCQSYYISHTFFLSFQITFTDKGTHFPLYHSSRSFLGVRWIFCISALLSSSWWPPRVIFLFSFWKLI